MFSQTMSLWMILRDLSTLRLINLRSFIKKKQFGFHTNLMSLLDEVKMLKMQSTFMAFNLDS